MVPDPEASFEGGVEPLAVNPEEVDDDDADTAAAVPGGSPPPVLPFARALN